MFPKILNHYHEFCEEEGILTNISDYSKISFGENVKYKNNRRYSVIVYEHEEIFYDYINILYCEDDYNVWFLIYLYDKDLMPSYCIDHIKDYSEVLQFVNYIAKKLELIK